MRARSEPGARRSAWPRLAALPRLVLKRARSGPGARRSAWPALAALPGLVLMRLAVRVTQARHRERRGRRERVALAVVLAIGVLLRVWFLLVWRPALTGYSDSGIYFQDAHQGVWTDPIRTVGYGMLLVALHWIIASLLFVTVLQHLMGLAAAVLLFAAVRAIGGPSWLGVIPAAALALDGDELFIEHAALSEAAYILLLAAMIYAGVRAWRSGRWRWAVLAGLCAGLGVWDRGAGVSLLPIVPLWLLFCRRRPTRATLVLAVLAAAVSLVVVEGYIQWREQVSGLSGLTTNGNWNLYARVAPWADCSKFSPPAGTEALCQSTPVAQRTMRSGEAYIYDASSPAVALLGPAYDVSSDPYAMSRLWEFSISAIEGQPGAYLNAVWQDMIRLVDPNHPSYGDLSATHFIDFLLYGPDYHSGQNEFVSYWQDLLYPHEKVHKGDITPLLDWERLTRLQGPLMVVLLLLCLGAPWLAVRETRAGARLLALIVLVLLLFPILSKGYDYRFVIPALGPLYACAALGGHGLYVRLARARARRRAAGEPSGATLQGT
jgi:hypothetical protein